MKGTFLCYIPRRFSAESLKLLGEASKIITAYEADGFSLSLRQLHYQLVTKNIIQNTARNYSRLGSLINDGRLAGLISWSAIEDRGRNLMGLRTYNGPASLLRESVGEYRRDLWAEQQWRPEVWIEKAALEDVIAGICNELRVDFFSCRGYNSQSEQWRAGQRFASYIQNGQRPIVFHLGDHDPSGIDMTRDNQERLSMFAGVPITVARLALNYNQVEQYKLVPNFVKLDDSRAPAYVEKYGNDSWELDALDPRVIRELIATAIGQIRDESLWSSALAREAADRDRLDQVIEEVSI
jgi:hypothetical protein